MRSSESGKRRSVNHIPHHPHNAQSKWRNAGMRTHKSDITEFRSVFRSSAHCFDDVESSMQAKHRLVESGQRHAVDFISHYPHKSQWR